LGCDDGADILDFDNSCGVAVSLGIRGNKGKVDEEEFNIVPKKSTSLTPQS
jgi:hypothetical protein